MIKVLGCALVGSLLFAGAIQFAPTAPAPKIMKAESVYGWVYDPVTKKTRVALPGVVALGYVPAKMYDDPEQAEDIANVELDKETSQKVLAQGK